MDETDFTRMVKTVREAESTIGKIDYSLTEKQTNGKDCSRSLYIVNDVKVGDEITKENVRSIRPWFGLHPKYLSEIIGKEFIGNFKKETRLSLELIK